MNYIEQFMNDKALSVGKPFQITGTELKFRFTNDYSLVEDTTGYLALVPMYHLLTGVANVVLPDVVAKEPKEEE